MAQKIINHIIDIKESIGAIQKQLEFQNGTIKDVKLECSKNTIFVNRFKGAMTLASASGLIGFGVVALRYLVMGG